MKIVVLVVDDAFRSVFSSFSEESIHVVAQFDLLPPPVPFHAGMMSVLV